MWLVYILSHTFVGVVGLLVGAVWVMGIFGSQGVELQELDARIASYKEEIAGLQEYLDDISAEVSQDLSEVRKALNPLVSGSQLSKILEEMGYEEDGEET